MIWAFEYLTDKQKQDLCSLNPLMDFQYNFAEAKYLFKDRFHEFENGKEIRKIRFFKLDQVRQGFICDNWEEARKLCMMFEAKGKQCEYAKEEMVNKYKWIPDYLNRMKDSPVNHWLSVIAIPVKIFLKHYEGDDMLKCIDFDELHEESKMNQPNGAGQHRSKDENYFIVFFDYENDYNNEDEIVKNTIESLFSFYYKNRSLKISRNVLLIKHNPSAYQNPKGCIDDALNEQIEKCFSMSMLPRQLNLGQSPTDIEKLQNEKNYLEYRLRDASKEIKNFVLPVQLSMIENHLGNFQNEIEYLQTKDE